MNFIMNFLMIFLMILFMKFLTIFDLWGDLDDFGGAEWPSTVFLTLLYPSSSDLSVFLKF